MQRQMISRTIIVHYRNWDVVIGEGDDNWTIYGTQIAIFIYDMQFAVAFTRDECTDYILYV